MRLRKKKSLLDQASDYVDAVRPQVEAAVAQAREAVEDFVETTALPAIADAREKAGPALVDARTRAAAGLADAREKAVPVVADARAKAAPVIATGAALAGEKASAVRELADAKVAQLKGEPAPAKGGRLRKILVFGAVAGAVGFAATKLQGGKQADTWQSSYVPSPPSEPASPVQSTPTTGTSTAAGVDDTDTPIAAASASAAAAAETDTGGASPDEAIADESETTHPVTTPDDPAEVVQVDDQK